MSQLFEIEIEPETSKTYLRLLLVIYSITVILVLYSSIYIWVKAIFLVFIFILLNIDWTNQSPCASIKKILYRGNEWILEMRQGNKESYVQAIILIHNPLFQLIEFSGSRKKKRFILFLDQITNNQLRRFNLKISQSSI